MLDRLRHDPLVGRHDEHGQVHAARAGHHLADEALVARHVHHAEHQAGAQRQLREAELDADAARLLLLEPVGVDPGQRLHERRLAVVDVPRRPQDEVPGAGLAHSATLRMRAPSLASLASIFS